MNPLQVNTGFLVAQSIATAFNIIAPIIIALVVQRRLGLSFKYVLFGALIFIAFQLLTRVPAVQILQAILAPQLKESRSLQIAWLAVLSLTAGLFEEIGRWIGYRFLMRKEEKTWAKGVLFGVGHGGIEAMLLVGVLGLLTVVNLTALSVMNLDTLPLPADQRAVAVEQIASINALPSWLPLAGAYERIWSMAFHVGASVLVLQCFRGGGPKWLAAAIAYHTLTNLVSAGMPYFVQLDRTTMTLVQEGAVTVFGAFGLWLAWRLKPRPAA